MEIDLGRSQKISLVTVCRNSAATIAKTIDSVLSQKDAGVEYIIIDGASTDGTQAVVESYGSNIDIFFSEPDEGIADAFNKGIALATGSIIGLINSNDTLTDGALQKVRNYFANHPDAEVVHGDILLLSGAQVIKRIKPPAHWWYPWRLVLFNHPATYVRRTVYERLGGFDTTYSIAMDADIFLRWSSNGVKIDYLAEILAHMQAGGVSDRCAIEQFRQLRNALIRHGFSRPLAHLQYWGKSLLWWILQIVFWLRRKLHLQTVTISTIETPFGKNSRP